MKEKEAGKGGVGVAQYCTCRGLRRRCWGGAEVEKTGSN